MHNRRFFVCKVIIPLKSSSCFLRKSRIDSKTCIENVHSKSLNIKKTLWVLLFWLFSLLTLFVCSVLDPKFPIWRLGLSSEYGYPCIFIISNGEPWEPRQSTNETNIRVQMATVHIITLLYLQDQGSKTSFPSAKKTKDGKCRRDESGKLPTTGQRDVSGIKHCLCELHVIESNLWDLSNARIRL